MPVPIAPTAAVAGQAARAGVQFNNLAAQVAFLLDPPFAFAFQSVAQSIPNGTPTPITMDQELVDTDNVHSLTVNTSRLTIVTAGRYRVVGQVAWTNNATGFRGVRLNKNGNLTSISRVSVATGVGNYMQVYDEILCAVGDYIELVGEQNSGAALTTAAAGADPSQTFIKSRWAGIS